MQRQYIKWYSPSLHREMELLAFGDRGFPVLVFPTSGGRFCEYEDRGMVNALRPKIDRGELQVICVDSVDQESWYNRSAQPADRLHRQNAFDAYLATGGRALRPRPHELAADGRHRVQLRRLSRHQFRAAPSRPGDLCGQHVGAFDIPRRFLNGYYNENAYFTVPLDYLPGLYDPWFLERIRRNYYVLAIGNRIRCSTRT